MTRSRRALVASLTVAGVLLMAQAPALAITDSYWYGCATWRAEGSYRADYRHHGSAFYASNTDYYSTYTDTFSGWVDGSWNNCDYDYGFGVEAGAYMRPWLGSSYGNWCSAFYTGYPPEMDGYANAYGSCSAPYYQWDWVQTINGSRAWLAGDELPDHYTYEYLEP